MAQKAAKGGSANTATPRAQSVEVISDDEANGSAAPAPPPRAKKAPAAKATPAKTAPASKAVTPKAAPAPADEPAPKAPSAAPRTSAIKPALKQSRASKPAEPPAAEADGTDDEDAAAAPAKSSAPDARLKLENTKLQRELKAAREELAKVRLRSPALLTCS
jgi:hypothetical protein